MRTQRLFRPFAARTGQRGAATLVVVMVLFFIVALVAAYTSRNLIFEQRTSANQYRAAQAFEAAEAGLEWAMTLLNSGRIDSACQPHPLANAATADDSFRQRYLSISDTTGLVTPRLRAGAAPLPRQAACVFNGNDWQCHCPGDDALALAPPAGDGPFPAFVVRFFDNSDPYPPGSLPYRPGVVRIQSTGCTRLDAAAVCADAATSGDGRATVTSLAALRSALAKPPAAAVTVRGNLSRDPGAGAGAVAAWQAVNPHVDAGGITVHAGGAVLPNPAWITAGGPGTPAGHSFFENDTPMFNLDADQMFASVFNLRRDTYRLQPATIFLSCAVDCSATTVRDLARLNPGRVLWVDGNFVFDIAGPIGSAAEPVMLLVTGSLNVTDPAARLYGVLYMPGTAWQQVGGSSLSVQGALLAEADLNVSGAGSARIEYDPVVPERLHWTHGSFVRVPGSWRDF